MSSPIRAGFAATAPSALPLRPEALVGRRVYLELFAKNLLVKDLDALRRAVAAAHPEIDFTTDHHNADVAIVLLAPFIGSYFTFVGIGDLAIDDHSHVDLVKVREIAANVDTMVVALDAKFPWLLDQIEPLADALLVGFDTDHQVLVDAALGSFAPTGQLPISFPINADALAVDDQGRCASPNDVPGFAKEAHMDGRPYVYVDADSNRYVLGHGLRYS